MSANIVQTTFEHTTQYAQLLTCIMLKKALGHHILHSMFTDVMKMLHVILCIWMSPLFLMVLLRPLSSLVIHPRSWTYMVLSVITSLRAPLKIPLSSEGLLITYFVTEARLSSAIKVADILRTFCIDKWQSETHQYHQKVLRNDDTTPLRMLLTVFLIVLVHPHTYGYFAKIIAADDPVTCAIHARENSSI
jgi:hypothetical protein